MSKTTTRYVVEIIVCRNTLEDGHIVESDVIDSRTVIGFDSVGEARKFMGELAKEGAK